MSNGTILITGGAGGLGTSCAHALKGHRLVIADHARTAVDQAVDALKASGIDAVGFACDITDPEAVRRLRAFTAEQGAFKGLVHTAGVSGTVGDARKVFDINLVATATIVDEFLQLARPGSAFVLFGSMMGHTVPADPRYDPALRESFHAAFTGPPVDLWPMFDACAGLPLALIRGANSDLLSAEVAAEMQARRPDMIFAEVPDRGHVPFLDEPESVTAIRRWLEAVR